PEGAVVVEGEVLGLDGAVADALPREPLPGQREVPASGISLRLNLRAGEGGEQLRHGEGAKRRPGAGSGHGSGARGEGLPEDRAWAARRRTAPSVRLTDPSNPTTDPSRWLSGAEKRPNDPSEPLSRPSTSLNNAPATLAPASP